MWFVIHLLNGMHPQDVEKKPFLPRQELKQRWQARDPAGMWRFFCRKTIILGTQLYFLGTIVETMVLNGSQWFLYTIWLFNIAMENHNFS